MVVIIIMISCKKKDDEPDPEPKKKYAWVSGDADSTGYGMILFSADGGETWQRQGQGSTALQGINVIDIWALDENNIWATGSKNVILRTNDGGQTWTQVPAPANKSNPELLSISIVNNTNIWISGSGGTVYRSTDGNSFTQVGDTTFFHNGLMQGIWAISPEKVYVVGGIGAKGERGFIGFTLDGGATWDSIHLENDYNRNEWISVVSSGNTIVVYGGKSHYVVSTDGGTIWMNDSVPAPGGGGGADINHLIMLNSQTWWGAFDMGHIFLTTDGGTTWTDQPTGQGGEFLVGIDTWDSQLALTVGALAGWPPEGVILKTTNGGTLWETKHTYNTYLNKVSCIEQ